ncbi:pantoate-beta-alanine ligase [Neurospora intermedia]|uniref:Pantoate--beta-alanine ligase n=1 Tax=Neurospora intermedia TaxID=5142 RepID=A0ABR3DGJ1_NEUIN
MRMQSTNALFRRATLSSSTLSIVRRSTTLTATRGFSSTSTTQTTSATTNSSASLPLRTPTRAQFPTTAATPSTTRTMASACSTSPSSSPGYEKIPNTSIRILRTVSSVRRFRKPLTLDSRSVALVPTMGALHAGHLSLIRAAARDNHHVIVSIYVNPAQFGVREDLGSYPVTWEADCVALAKLDRELADDGENLGRISAVFAPTTGEMYPAGFPGQEPDSKGSFVTITPVGEVLEGASRPTFFRGVATVCMKLFNVCQPDRVYFGQKDVQQTVVIKRLVEDFLMPIEQVVIVPTARDQEDGLALSSRNVYLGERRRKVANVLYRALKAAEEAYAAGEGKRDREGVLGAAQKVMEETLAEQMKLSPSERVKYEVDYLSLADPDTMLELEAIDTKKGGILSGAVRFLPVEEPKEGEDLGHSGGPLVRLIDNIILPPK